VQRQDASLPRVLDLLQMGPWASFPAQLHTRGLGQGPRWWLRSARLGSWTQENRGTRLEVVRSVVEGSRFTCFAVTPVVSALVDAWSRRSGGVTCPGRHRHRGAAPPTAAATGCGSSVVGLHSACAVGVLARLQAIDERVSERGRALGGALCSRGRLVYEEQRAGARGGAGMEAVACS